MASSASDQLLRLPRHFDSRARSAGVDNSLSSRAFGTFEAFSTARDFYLDPDDSRPQHTPDIVRILSELARLGISVWHAQSILYATSEHTLNGGAFKRVRIGTYKGRTIAVKEIRRDAIWRTNTPLVDQDLMQQYSSLIQDIIMEIRVMSHAAIAMHPNIVSLEAVAFEELADWSRRIDYFRPILILPPSDKCHPDLGKLLEHGCVQHILRNDDIPLIIGDICDGMAALHSFGVIHADLKPENILLYSENDRMVAKISDFGLSGILQSKDDARGGDRVWQPPECLGTAHKNHTQAGDVYAVGLVSVAISLRTRTVWPKALNGLELDSLRQSEQDLVPDLLVDMLQQADAIQEVRQTWFERISEVVRACTSYWPDRRLTNLARIRPYLSGESSLLQQTRQLAPFGSESLWRQPKRTRKLDLLHFGGLSQLSLIKYALPDSVRELCFKQGLESLGRISSAELDYHLNLLSLAYMRHFPVDKILGDPRYHGLKVKLDAIRNPMDYQIEAGRHFLGKSHRDSGTTYGAKKLSFRGIFRRSRRANPSEIRCRPNHKTDKLGSGSELCNAVLGLKYETVLDILSRSTRPIELVNEKIGPCKEPLLYFAASRSTTSICAILLAFGAEVNGHPGDMCIFNNRNAVWNCQTSEMAWLLLQWNCSNLLHSQCRDCGSRGRCSLEVWERDTRMHYCTIAHDLARQPQKTSVLEAVMTFEPALANARDSQGKTPLDLACRYRCYRNVEVLLNWGSQINAADNIGVTPLAKAFSAAIGGSGIAMLSPETCQAEAVSYGYNLEAACQMVAKLIQLGADVEAVDTKGYSPELYAFPPINARPHLYRLVQIRETLPICLWSEVRIVFQSPTQLGPQIRHTTVPQDVCVGSALLPSRQAASCNFLFEQVLPNAQGLELSCVFARTRDALGLDFVLEVLMLAPNLAHNTRQSLFRRNFSLGQLCPESDVQYHVFMGKVPLKHKADLIVQIQLLESSEKRSGLLVFASSLQYTTVNFEATSDQTTIFHANRFSWSLRTYLEGLPERRTLDSDLAVGPGTWWHDQRLRSRGVVEGSMNPEDTTRQLKELLVTVWGQTYITKLESLSRVGRVQT